MLIFPPCAQQNAAKRVTRLIQIDINSVSLAAHKIPCSFFFNQLTAIECAAYDLRLHFLLSLLNQLCAFIMCVSLLGLSFKVHGLYVYYLLSISIDYTHTVALYLANSNVC